MPKAVLPLNGDATWILGPMASEMVCFPSFVMPEIVGLIKTEVEFACQF